MCVFDVMDCSVGSDSNDMCMPVNVSRVVYMHSVDPGCVYCACLSPCVCVWGGGCNWGDEVGVPAANGPPVLLPSSGSPPEWGPRSQIWQW